MSLETLQLHEVIPTATFVSTFKDFLSTLLDIIREQGKQLEFDGYYISYLLGNLTEEEFQEIAQGFVAETHEMPFEVLKDKVRILNALRGQDLSVREMAQYLHCSEDDIVRALQLLQG
jgi:Trp operon repressor